MVLCPGGSLSGGISVQGSLSGRLPPYGKEWGGTHPTGMHSCFEIFIHDTEVYYVQLAF